VPRERLTETKVTVIGVAPLAGRLPAACSHRVRAADHDFDVVDHTNLTTQGYWARTSEVPSRGTAKAISQLDPAIAVEMVRIATGRAPKLARPSSAASIPLTPDRPSGVGGQPMPFLDRRPDAR